VGTIDVNSTDGNATGITAAGFYGNATIQNVAGVTTYSYAGNSIGLYGYSVYGDVSIGNNGVIDAYSYNGLADGIFASGVNVTIANGDGADIYAGGTGWAAGIEAHGGESVGITNNNAEIVAAAYG